jgi:hypothetical protein
MPPSDFPPFVMTIEDWESACIGYSDGRTIACTDVARLDYRSRGHWALTYLTVEQATDLVGSGARCEDGVYETFDRTGHVTGRVEEPGMCAGAGRWIGFGVAERVPWERQVANGRVVDTNGGEQVTFDLATGLPVLYEAGMSSGQVGRRTVYRVERYGG